MNEKNNKIFRILVCHCWYIGIILNLVGFDDISLFIGLNPILNALSSSKACCDIINSIPYLWYILSMITMIGYGLVIDALKNLIRKK